MATMSTIHELVGDRDKTAAPSLNIEYDSESHQAKVAHSEKPDSEKRHADHDFRSEERDDIPAAVEPPYVDAGDYPDGGLTAWLVVIGASCACFSTFGMVNSWGTFQAYYEEVLLAGTPSSTISWIGSIQGALVFGPGFIFGRLFDIGYFRLPFTTASSILVMCTLLVAECTRYWHFMLCQGLTIGMCSGAIFGPAMATVGHWFKRRRAVALGIVSVGSSAGGALIPIAFNRLVNEVGFKWAMRTLGFVLLFTLGIASLTLRRRLPPVKAHGSLIDLTQFKNPAFALYNLAGFVCMLGLYTFMIYVQSSALEQGVDPEFAFYLVPLGNAGSVVGRLGAGALGGKFGIMDVITPSIVLTAVFTYIWPFVHGTASIAVLTTLYGASSGAFAALLAGPIMAMGPTEDVGKRTGIYFSIMALGELAGPPISGAIQDATGSYKPAGIYAGTMLLASVVGMVASRWFIMGGTFKGKV